MTDGELEARDAATFAILQVDFTEVADELGIAGIGLDLGDGGSLSSQKLPQTVSALSCGSLEMAHLFLALGGHISP